MMLSKYLNVRTCSNKVHPATRDMLEKYPMRELREYAKSIGIKPSELKAVVITQLLEKNATICGSLGN